MTAPLVRGTSVSAHRGTRRTAPQFKQMMRSSVDRETALTALKRPEVREAAIAGCTVAYWNGVTIRELPVRELPKIDISEFRPVRRLGSFHGARSKLMVHSTGVEGETTVEWAESKMERLCMIELDRESDIHCFRSQPMVMLWPLGNYGTITQIPDIAAQFSDHLRIISVRPMNLVTGYTRAILGDLMIDTFDTAHIEYDLMTGFERQRVANLQILATMRWKPPVTEEPWWPAIDAARPRTLGAVADIAGHDYVGRGRALYALSQCHFHTNLNLPFRTSLGVWW